MDMVTKTTNNSPIFMQKIAKSCYFSQSRCGKIIKINNQLAKFGKFYEISQFYHQLYQVQLGDWINQQYYDKFYKQIIRQTTSSLTCL
ncbi:hypothetical protein B0189_10850 [Moraxella cuniculi]|nr:hypothetical protein B0189_10850 [Moraxella cuniculi]